MYVQFLLVSNTFPGMCLVLAAKMLQALLRTWRKLQAMLKHVQSAGLLSCKHIVVQAVQGLPGYRGSDTGIGIGIGLQQLAQARAHAQLNAQQALTSNGLLSSHLNGMQTGFASANDRDTGMPGATRCWLCPVNCMSA